MAKRTLSRRDGTAWPESGIRSLGSFERLWLRLQGTFRILLRVKCPDGSGSSSESWKTAQHRWLWPQLQVLGFCFFFARLRRRFPAQGSILAPAPIKISRWLRAKCSGSCGFGTALAPHRQTRRLWAARMMLSGQERLAKRSTSRQEGAE